MVSSPSPPPAPNPTATSQAQTASNQQTALYQAGLNDINQNTPLGSINYNINPGQTDANGNVLSTPSTTSDITLNPLVQNALTQNLQTSGAEGNLANKYISNVQNTLSQPPPTPDAAYQAKIAANQQALEQPYIDRSNEMLSAQLANQGITQGSDAYHNAMLDQNNALNNLQEQNIQNATQQEQQQYAMGIQGYTLPQNELSALQSGSQVAQPSFSTPSPTGVNPTNVSGNIWNAYNAQVGNANAQAASQNQLFGSLFGLGGSLGAAAIMSDRRLKTNIRRIGATKSGIPVYSYVYKWGGKRQFGVMADEVEKRIPEAVITMPDGYKAVNYSLVR